MRGVALSSIVVDRDEANFSMALLYGEWDKTVANVRVVCCGYENVRFVNC